MSNIKTRRFATYSHPHVTKPEENHSPSETVPSKSLSLKEIIARDLVNMVTPADKSVPFFDDNFLIPEFGKMDLVDIDIWKDNLDAHLRDVNLTIKDEKAKRKASLEFNASAKGSDGNTIAVDPV